KDDMERIRTVQRAYHSEGMTVGQIAEEKGISEETVRRDLFYNTHLLPLSDLSDSNDTASDPLMIEDDRLSVDEEAYRRICCDLLEPLFSQLSEQDRFILGSWFGVFGYEEKTDDDLSLELILTSDGLRKAKKAALRRLLKKIPGSRLEEWKIVHKAVIAECRRDYDPNDIEDEEYDDRPKIFIRC
ncbi:MAG: DeoR family transcriptional regulator, partial [Lachnospiraceae bacterium]|nr:DeoR family transcriptional regulator [Lachnospiraceae bacterium]